MDSYTHEIAFFLGGLVVGAVLCYIVLAQVYKHKRVKDELLKSKRAAVKAQRTLDKFLKTSLDMFEELDSAHKQYVQFLKETVQRIAPSETLNHNYLEENNDLSFSPKKKQRKEGNIEPELQGSIDGIQPPNVLKSPEIPEDGKLSNSDLENTASKLEEVLEEAIEENKEKIQV